MPRWTCESGMIGSPAWAGAANASAASRPASSAGSRFMARSPALLDQAYPVVRRAASDARMRNVATTESTPRAHRLGGVLREDERVTALELFFDLVFVLAITQCTALMAADPTWQGVGRGVLVLGLLWWSWVGYAWLTSV